MWLHTVRDNFADGHINRASLPTMRGIGRRFSKIYLSNGGEGEIRTHGPRKGTPVFKTGAFNRSATSPILLRSAAYSALNQSLEPHVTHLHCVLHAGRKHGRPRERDQLHVLPRDCPPRGSTVVN